MKRKLEIDLDDKSWTRIERLVEVRGGDLEAFVSEILDHVDQGIYRSGSWERGWLAQCLGEECIEDAYDPGEDPRFPSRKN